MAELADAADSKSYKQSRLIVYLAEINKLIDTFPKWAYLTHLLHIFEFSRRLKQRNEDAGTTHHPWRQGSRLQASKQQLVAMLKLCRGQKSPHQHEGREPL